MILTPKLQISDQSVRREDSWIGREQPVHCTGSVHKRVVRVLKMLGGVRGRGGGDLIAPHAYLDRDELCVVVDGQLGCTLEDNFFSVDNSHRVVFGQVHRHQLCAGVSVDELQNVEVLVANVGEERQLDVESHLEERRQHDFGEYFGHFDCGGGAGQQHTVHAAVHDLWECRDAGLCSGLGRRRNNRIWRGSCAKMIKMQKMMIRL